MPVIKTAHAATFAFAAFVGSSAQAVVAVPETTFEFFGVCSDCTLAVAADQPLATLVLRDYTPGTSIDIANFVSFSYVGSDLVSPYTVADKAAAEFPEEADFTVETGPGSGTRSTSILTIEGQVGAADAAYNFTLIWDDGLKFNTSTTGGWYTCSIGTDGRYYSGSNCFETFNQDFGVGQWNAPAAAVPEPSTWALAGLGLLGLAAMRRHKV